MKAMILVSEKYEEVEALTVVDYLRRAEIDIDIISTVGKLETIGDHGIKIIADKLLEDVNVDDYDLVITPGGMGGTKALKNNERVIEILNDYKNKKKYIASICASPMVLEKAGIAKDIKGTIFPKLIDEVNFKEYDSESLVVFDEKEKVITSKGPATAVYFALEIIRILKGEEKVKQIEEALLIPEVHNYIRKNM